MLIAVSIAVALTIAIAAVVLAPRLLPQRIRIDSTPDGPLAFGVDMSWLAIKTTDPLAVIAALDIADVAPANWNSGIGAIYNPQMGDSRIFISPPIKGWTIVAGVSLPLPAGRPFIDKMTPMIERLGKTFPDVQYYATFPIIDFYAWARVVNGRTIRSFAIGEGGVILNTGRRAIEERKLGLSYTEVRGIRDRRGDLGGELELSPTEQHVLALAAASGLNPMSIGSVKNDAGVGWLGKAPASWRAERRRSAA